MTPKLAIGLTIVGIIAFFAIVVPFFVQDPNKVSDVGLTAPSAEHWLGTTQTGQDVFAQLAYCLPRLTVHRRDGRHPGRGPLELLRHPRCIRRRCYR